MRLRPAAPTLRSYLKPAHKNQGGQIPPGMLGASIQLADDSVFDHGFVLLFKINVIIQDGPLKINDYFSGSALPESAAKIFLSLHDFIICDHPVIQFQVKIPAAVFAGFAFH